MRPSKCQERPSKCQKSPSKCQDQRSSYADFREFEPGQHPWQLFHFKRDLVCVKRNADLWEFEMNLGSILGSSGAAASERGLGFRFEGLGLRA